MTEPVTPGTALRVEEVRRLVQHGVATRHEVRWLAEQEGRTATAVEIREGTSGYRE